MWSKSLKRKLGFAASGVTAGIGVVILALYVTPLSYLYCLARESAWLRATNERQLERSLFAFYSKKEISPSASLWGKEHILQAGQHMTQYLIFGKEPLDVVFFADGSIDAIYTSYE